MVLALHYVFFTFSAIQYGKILPVAFFVNKMLSQEQYSIKLVFLRIAFPNDENFNDARQSATEAMERQRLRYLAHYLLPFWFPEMI